MLSNNGKISLLINVKRRVSIGGTDLFRPIQYIGSKIKLAERIASHICSYESSGVVLDPFSGTGVMGQEFAKRGWKVISSDALNFCNIMARATLGIGKKTDDKLEQEWNSLQKDAENIPAPKKWTGILQTEKQCIEEEDAQNLISLEKNYPRRTTKETMSTSRHHKIWRLTDVFAGTYLGVKQSVDLDRYRWALEQRKSAMSSWCYDSILTALMSAASNASYSAGKHFAQFHNLKNEVTEFHKERLIQDRQIEIKQHTTESLASIINASNQSGSGHQQLNGPMEELLGETFHFDWIYADPPYTAQQYSRFYHLLESYASTKPIRLMHQKGEPTQGLIPPREDRHQSRFSKKTTIESAFKDLITLSEKCDANLAISYSTSRKRNSRMISLDKLRLLLESTFEVEMIRFDHKYREFNKAELSDSSDSEDVLLLCRRKS